MHDQSIAWKERDSRMLKTWRMIREQFRCLWGLNLIAMLLLIVFGYAEFFGFPTISVIKYSYKNIIEGTISAYSEMIYINACIYLLTLSFLYFIFFKNQLKSIHRNLYGHEVSGAKFIQWLRVLLFITITYFTVFIAVLYANYNYANQSYINTKNLLTAFYLISACAKSFMTVFKFVIISIAAIEAIKGKDVIKQVCIQFKAVINKQFLLLFGQLTAVKMIAILAANIMAPVYYLTNPDELWQGPTGLLTAEQQNLDFLLKTDPLADALIGMIMISYIVAIYKKNNREKWYKEKTAVPMVNTSGEES